MFLPLLLTLLPAAFSLPHTTTSTHTPTPEPYNCGYALTRHNSSAYVGLYAHNRCEDFFFNETIIGYQDAFAYRLYGGCECRFAATGYDCWKDVDGPIFKGPTSEESEMAFADPKPKWYTCKGSA
ncbi:hypothetical protein HBI56_145190 [Parastagonospora nodorum]|uniref:Uncharacterized protein n=1 Tax=Phaeosphaeria nodorum (strain SN15 / ATCC MYA-4574 / FGSC 10173) TaxID=321614 RepID=A0A7U2F830_PHANO|nr:hypothetical protein HBH56_031840 [Parastagonospora nodorum]QRD00377.1 hypothetical protein JI435_072340 [Parastagonospora nodorum SN15]KAH3933977.1 hypothetical protein HBH54_067610 [Parastagonospora nodorum]KAH3952356.1 hypothetical protein HBH53_042440 [Parastagonospora nodorum]KAH3979482.1 hypothetical protein HBH51_053470 [Parastagonospora nodorum]